MLDVDGETVTVGDSGGQTTVNPKLYTPIIWGENAQLYTHSPVDGSVEVAFAWHATKVPDTPVIVYVISILPTLVAFSLHRVTVLYIGTVGLALQPDWAQACGEALPNTIPTPTSRRATDLRFNSANNLDSNGIFNRLSSEANGLRA